MAVAPHLTASFRATWISRHQKV